MSKYDSYETISRRAFIIGGLKLVSFGALIARLGYLQLFRFQDYKVLSDKNRIRVFPILPSRGEILDELGKPIVRNRYIYKLILDKEYKADINDIMNTLSSIFPDKIVARPDFSGKVSQVVLVDNLTWSEIAQLSIFIATMPGVSIERYTERQIVGNEAAFSHIAGYTADDQFTNVLGFKSGVIGMEKELDDVIKGELGEKSVEVNVIGKLVRDLDVTHPKAGANVKLSINYDLQEYAYNLFKECEYRAGSCVVMDIFTGQVKAMVSFPGYHPSEFGAGGWERFKSDTMRPLTNRAICGEYPPGSAFKLITAIAFLESVAGGASYSTDCYGVYTVGDNDFHCWRRGGHGNVDVRRALVESCDIFFYSISRTVGMKKIAEYARLFGFGQKTGAGFSYERPGLIPDPDWKRAVYKQPWYPYETILSAIGQGGVLSTAMQLAVMVSMIANGGFNVKPTMIWSDELELLDKVGVSDRTISTMYSSMVDVCNKPYGTAYWSLIRSGLKSKIAGKTGTSQVVRITRKQRESGEYKDFDSQPWEQRDHALFVGFAPVNDPKYAVSVILEHEISGSKAAAPFAARVLDAAVRGAV